MKKIRLSSLVWGAAFAMLALSACTNDVQEVVTEKQQEGDKKEVQVVASAFLRDGETQARTLITPADDGAGFAWVEGTDTIGILPEGASQVYFKIDNVNADTPDKATFESNAWDLKDGVSYTAYYPFVQDIMLNPQAVPVDYSVQTYSARDDGKVSLSHDYMAATSQMRDGNKLNFEFQHLGALVEVKFTLPAEEAVRVTQFTLCADEAIFPVKGTFDLTKNSVAISPDEESKLSAVVVNVENLIVGAGETVSVFFMMPPMAEVETTLWKAAVVYGPDDTRLPLEITTSKSSLQAQLYYTLETKVIEQPEDALVVGNNSGFSSSINDALGTLGGTKLRFVTSSPRVSETVIYTDENAVEAYAVRNGDWLEVHTLAKSFELGENAVSMFNAGKLKNYLKLTLLDLNGFDTSSVTDMTDMFYGCSGLTALDLSSFDTSSVTDMTDMFYGCSGLTALDLSSFDTSSVTYMSYMFYGCYGLTALDLSSFDTSSVMYMNNMFCGCFGLTALNFGEGFDTSSVTDMNSMFYGCSGLTALDLSSFITQQVTNMSYMFYDCSGLTALDLSSFDTSSVTDMCNMFQNCYGLTELDLSGFDTSSVTYMCNMFQCCYGLTELDLSGFDTSLVTDMSYMFADCWELEALDVSGFTLTSEQYVEQMFYNVGYNNYLETDEKIIITVPSDVEFTDDTEYYYINDFQVASFNEVELVKKTESQSAN